MQEPTAHFLPDVAVHGGVGYADTCLWVPLGRAVPSDTSLPGTETQKGLTLSRGCSFLALPRAVNLRKAARLFPEVAGVASLDAVSARGVRDSSEGRGPGLFWGEMGTH